MLPDNNMVDLFLIYVKGYGGARLMQREYKSGNLVMWDIFCVLDRKGPIMLKRNDKKSFLLFFAFIALAQFNTAESMLRCLGYFIQMITTPNPETPPTGTTIDDLQPDCLFSILNFYSRRPLNLRKVNKYFNTVIENYPCCASYINNQYHFLHLSRAQPFGDTIYIKGPDKKRTKVFRDFILVAFPSERAAEIFLKKEKFLSDDKVKGKGFLINIKLDEEKGKYPILVCPHCRYPHSY